MLCNILAHKAINSPAKIFFSIATGKRCARPAPIGAINMLTSDKDKTFVTSIRSLAREMGITVVAEYVESAEVLRELERMEIHRAQGYYIGRPAPKIGPRDWLPPT